MAWSTQARQAAIAARKARTTGHDAGIKNRKAAAQSELGRALVRKSTRVGPIGNIKALSTGPSSPLPPPSTPASSIAKANMASMTPKSNTVPPALKMQPQPYKSTTTPKAPKHTKPPWATGQ